MQEILPVIAFIAAYLAAKWSGHSEQAIYWATAVLMKPDTDGALPCSTARRIETTCSSGRLTAIF